LLRLLSAGHNARARASTALHYRDHGRKQSRWRVFWSDLLFDSPAIHKSDPYSPLRRYLANVPYAYVETAQPDVFTYGTALEKPGGLIYQLIFYSAAIVYAWPARKRLTRFGL
jgi:hypothetical protein